MNKLIKKIQDANTVAIFTHINADPDALGSAGAMYFALKSMGKQCVIFLNEEPSSLFKFLNLENVFYKKEDLKTYDLCIAVDIATLSRFGIFGDYFIKQKNIIAIDHHKERTSFAKLELVDYTASSCCEVLLDLFEQMQLKIEKNIANCLYFGLVGDTGGLMFSNTTAKTLDNAKKLLKLSAETTKINDILQTITHGEILLLSRVINRLQIKNNISYSYILEKDRKEFKIANFDTNKYATLIRNIDNIDISILLKQKNGKNFTVSLRSNELYNVSSVASRFGGGGHKCAAGFSMVGTLPKIKKIVLEEVEKLEKC